MNPYLRNLARIEFVVTTACTGRCRHCSQGDHNSNESIDKALAADAVLRIAENYNIKSVMTFGGEPLLKVDTVCAIHRAAKKMNIPHRQLITNGYFSKDFSTMKSVAESLADSGVNDLLLSVDAFHQETIPLQYVIEFAKAALDVGVPIRVQPAWLINEESDNPYNNKTRELLSKFSSMGIKANEGNIIFPAGNALKYLSEYFDLSKAVKNPYEEDPYDIKAICFSANGDILGKSIYKNDINSILRCYTPIK